MSLYMDNGSTSYPKAPGVGKAMWAYIENIGVNINRGSYNRANNTLMDVWDTREKIQRLMNCNKNDCVVFTSGATSAINQILQGFLKPNDHVIISSFEHNAVLRGLTALSKIGVEYSIIPADVNGISNLENVGELFKENTKIAIVNHTSNVSGVIFPLEEMAKICTKRNIPLVVDGAQSGGHIPIEFEKLNLSALALPGHKGLLGPQGVGVLILKRDFAKKLEPIIYGGTGSKSHSEKMPDFLPDKFEAGTQNLPGIFGLNRAVDFVLEKGVKYFRDHEIKLVKAFLEGLQDLSIRVIGNTKIENRIGLISIDFLNLDNGIVSKSLEEEYGILTRSGLHCSPLAHRTLNTYPEGTVRFSFGYTTEIEDIEFCIRAIKDILRKKDT